MSINLNISNGMIPKHIQESWERCYSNGLMPTTIDKEHILGESELVEYYDKYDELLFYATSILEDVYQSIQGTEFLLLIATQEGYIIDSVGEPSFIRHADNVSLRKGANWLEESKGTNAIGTAIVENKSIVIHGNQHFWQDNHFLTCTAAPIQDPQGRLLGILNFSSYQQNYNPLTLGLVKRAAHSIEQALLLAQTQRQSEKSSKDLHFIYNYHPSPLITVNKKGYITRMNLAATRTIGRSEQSTIGKMVESVLTSSEGREKQYLFNEQIFTSHLLPYEQQDETYLLLRGESKKQNGLLSNRYSFADIVSQDRRMDEAISIAQRAAILDMNLLISGETGTGKELFAQSIHGVSLRSEQPFIAINCSAIPESLLESELFGYEKGAFTGAKSQGQIGKFEAADGGTLFLDEIGDMPLVAQAALLRVLQEKCITRIGGIHPRPIDVRIIAATHKDLQKEIEEGRFRADLYYRLNGLTIKLPSLRERCDVLLLAEHILTKQPFKNEKVELTEEAKLFISEYEWTGNFRELQNVLQQAAFLTTQNVITKSLLVSLCQPSHPEIKRQIHHTQILSLREHEMALIKQVLEETKGNISRAAKALNIGRNTLYRKMKEFDLLN